MDWRLLWASHYLLGVGLDGGYGTETVKLRLLLV